MTERRSEFCSDVSVENAEPLVAPASRVDHWILVEYRGLWGYDAVGASGLSDELKQHLRDRRDARPNTKLLFVRRPHRRAHPALAVMWGSSPERGGGLFHVEIDGYDDLLGLDLTTGPGGGEPVGHPVLLVCTHGKHDRCSARRGRPLYEALEAQAEEGWVWQSSHIGGDRFAGNVVFLPDGLYFGRVAPAEAWGGAGSASPPPSAATAPPESSSSSPAACTSAAPHPPRRGRCSTSTSRAVS